MPRVLLGVSGSVAAVKVPQLVKELKDRIPQLEVKIVLTQSAVSFLNGLDLSGVEIFDDQDEWASWKKIGDPVLHIQLRTWADLLLLAPLSANTMAKLAAGQCDNLLTSIVRAWDTSKPLIVAPAMNTLMWKNPFTQRHLDIITDVYGAVVVDPVEKLLACGDFGMGAMAHVADLAEKIQNYLLQNLSMK